MRFLLIILILQFSSLVNAQEIEGIWRGKRTQLTGGCFQEYYHELQISTHQNLILGRSYSYTDNKRFTKILFKGNYDSINHTVNISETFVLEYNVPEHCIPCIKTYKLSLTNQLNDEMLAGDWTGHELGSGRSCVPGKIELKKETSSLFTPEPFSKEEFERNFQPEILESTSIETLVDIIIEVPEIRIELYDNAEIDDDTISVYLNKNLLLYKKRLTDKALIVDITAIQGVDYELIMYAENLGKIPPNTSLMIINAGEIKHEIRISSTRQKSASVKFRYKKPVEPPIP